MARELVVRLIGDDRQLQRSFLRSSSAVKTFDRDVTKSARGAVAASLSFRGLGRAAAFGSAQFLGGAGIVFALKSTIQAAEESQRVLGQTRNAVLRSGLSWSKYGKQIQEAALAQSNISGFDDESLLSTFSNLVRRTGDVNKALRLNALSANVARGRNIELEQAQQLVLKASIGNIGALRRLGINISKHATAVRALALLQDKYAGSAAAFGRTAEGAQARFSVALQNTQEVLGGALLPSITKYLNRATAWLSSTKNQERLQRDLKEAVAAVSGILSDATTVVRDVTHALGGLKHTLELLLGLKLVSWAVGATGGVKNIGKAAVSADGEVATLSTSLAGLGGIAVAPIVIPIEIKVGHDERAWLEKNAGILGNAGKALLDIATAGGAVTGGNLFTDLGLDTHSGIAKSLGGQGGGGFPIGGRNITPIPNEEALNKAIAARKQIAARLQEANREVRDAVNGATGDAGGTHFTATQRNTFFDNAIARILLRGGLGSISQQIAALERADTLIAARIKVTKDVTRRLNLEDELLQNQAQIRQLRAQQAADAAQAAADARQKALDALQKAAEARNARQFRALGLTDTGDTRAPSVRQLRNAANLFQSAVAGTFLDTKKTQSVLSGIRKVLSGGLGAVGRDVRLKVQEILDGLNQQLKGHQRNLTRFQHLNSNAFVSALGLNLTREQKRRIQAVFSITSAHGTIPAGQSVAFSGAGAQTVVVHNTTTLDGKVIAKSTTKHQQRNTRARAKSRSGPYAGLH